MKKIFSTIFAFAAAAVCATGASAAETIAAVQSESGQIEELGELSLGDVELMNIGIDMPCVLSNYSDSAYNYGDYLDENNRAVYDALQVWTDPTLDSMTVTLPKKVSVVLSSVPGTDDFTQKDQEKFNEAIANSCNPGIVTKLFDTPELFWISPKDILFGVDGASYSYNPFRRTYTIYFNKIKLLPALSESFADLDEAFKYKTLYEKAAETFVTRGATRFETLKSLHDNIVKFTYYDVDARFLDNMLGAFVEPGVVCEGYSEAFKYFCDRLDIPCVCVYGNIDKEQNAAHMWNYVQMDDGKWYGVDLTWDDKDGKDNVQFTRNYFLKGSSSFNYNHFAESDYIGTTLVYPTLAEDDYDPKNAVPEPTSENVTDSEPTYLRGDFNRDGTVNAADLVLCARAVVGAADVPCDYNEDGETNSVDIIFMRKILFTDFI